MTEKTQIARSVGGSAAARMLVLPISAILGIIVTRLIIQNYGAESYAQYMLLVGIVSMIPFADLGISAAIMNATAGAVDPRSDAHLKGTLVTAIRILVSASFTVILLALVITVSGLWPTILGEGLEGKQGEYAAGICLAVFGLAMLVSYGERILIGLGKNALAILLGGVQTPLVLIVLLAAISSGVDLGPYVAIVSYATLLVTGGLMLAVANRSIRPLLGSAICDAWRLRTVRGERVLDTAWPMLIQMVTIPFAMQSGRLVLSHTAGVAELAKYSLASQMFNPIVSVSVAASMALWPIFAKERAQGTSGISPRKLAWIFAGLGAAASAVMAAASGFLANLASGGSIQLPWQLVLAYSLFVVIQAAKNPLGSYLTDARGLRFQAYMSFGMLPVILLISIALASHLGAVGPVVASAIGVLIFQVVANWIYVARLESSTAVADRDELAAVGASK